MRRVTIIGAGAYSIALSRILNTNGVKVTIYTKFADEEELLNRKRGNDRLLPGVKLMRDTEISNNLGESVKDCNIIILAVPSDATRLVLQDLKQFYNDQVLCITTKGIEQSTGYFMNQVIKEELTINNLCVISGPSIASEIADFLPTVVTAAGKKELTNLMNSYLANDKFEVEETTDMIGTLICGALKNVLAIGAGILSARNAGENALATMITNGLKEIGQFCQTLGGQAETVYLSCGLGDVIACCAGNLSRNNVFGVLIGEGHSVEEAITIQNKTIEGYTALAGARRIIRDNNLKAPIIETICEIVLDGTNPDLLLTAICKQ